MYSIFGLCQNNGMVDMLAKKIDFILAQSKKIAPLNLYLLYCNTSQSYYISDVISV